MKFSSGELVVDVNAILGNIQPKLLVLIGAFLTYWLIAKKRVGVNKVMLLMIAISIIGYFTKILA